MHVYQHPKALPRSTDFRVSINDRSIEVLATGVADFAPCALGPADFPARIEITILRPAAPAELTVRPRAKNLTTTLSGYNATLILARPEKLSLDFGWDTKPLYLFTQPPETSPPAPDTPGLVTFPAGQVTEIPNLTLEDHQTLYLPGGSVLKGRIHIKGKRGIRLCGHGIFDGSFYSKDAGEAVPSIILERCPNVLVEDIIMIRPQAWMLVLAACTGATVRNLKQIGEVISSDGIDVLGSSDVLIEDCFLHNNDDCVVVKAFHLGANNVAGTNVDARVNVQNVLVQHCTFANWTCGNAMEIGHELSVETVRGVTFRDIDVLHVHGTGAVFSIHNNDRALITDVLFEDIRIEHCYDKFIDFRISKSRFSTDAERGRIRGVTLRNITWHRSVYSTGYTVSLIGGWDAAHTIEDITLEHIIINGTPVRHLDELELHTRHCHDLRLI
jgi:hypothetical protein